MSATANWSYTNVATVRPFLSLDQWTGQAVYGEPYEIACTWTADNSQERMAGGQGGSQGAEFIAKHTIFTEDRRPKYLDLIIFDGSDGWEEIRAVMTWDMSPFGEIPDYKLVT